MAVDAPPGEQRTVTSVEDDPVEALIEEARQGAGVASVVAITAVAAIVAANGAGPTRGKESALDGGGAAPGFATTDESATVVSAWGQVHQGWVIVYSDRRVFLQIDVSGPLPEGVARYSTVQRYLTPEGLDDVRSGSVGPSELLADSVPPEMWADANFTVYAPSVFAVCPHRAEFEVDLAEALQLLPAGESELLRGTQRWFTSIGPMHHPEPPAYQCFALPPEQARTVVENADWYHNNRAETVRGFDRTNAVDVGYRAVDGTLIGLGVIPLMPDDQGVALVPGG